METEKQLTLRDYMRVLFRQKAVILTTFITVMLTVTIGLMMKTPVYEARVKMLISAEKQVDSPYYTGLMGNQNNVLTLTQSEIVKSDPIMQRSVSAVGLYDLPLDYEGRFCSPLKNLFIKIRAKSSQAKLDRMKPEEQKGFRYRMALETLKQNTTIEPIRDTNLFYIKVQDFSGYGAAVMTNVVSRSYVIFDLEQQVAELQLKYGEKNLAVTQLKDNIAKMEKSLNGEPLPNIEAIGPASVKIIEQADIPIRPTGIPKMLTLLLAIFMALFLGTILAFAFEYLDQAFRSPLDIEDSLRIPFLGFVPRKAGDKYYRNLSEQLFLIFKDKQIRTVLFTSALRKEGVSTVIANVVKYLTKDVKRRVLVVDANLRHPGLYKSFKVAPTPGLADILSEKATFDHVVVDLEPHLSFVPAGETELNPVTLLESHHMERFLKIAKERYELVLIDCANLRDYKDAVIISIHADGVVCVVKEGSTRRQVVKFALAPLEEKKINILGAILNNRSFPIPKFVYERV